MSVDLERVYTINLGKVLLSQSQHRAVRALNMIREFARHHMKIESIKIDEQVAQQIWARGVRRPPRKIRVMMSITEDKNVLVTLYNSDDTKGEKQSAIEDVTTEAKGKIKGVTHTTTTPSVAIAGELPDARDTIDKVKEE